MPIAKGLVSRTVAALASGLPIGGATVGAGSTYVALVRLPEATKEAYKALWRHEKIGPNLKTLFSLTAPAVIVMVPPTISYASTLSGAGYGVYLGFIDPLKVFDRSVEVVKDFDHKIVDQMVKDFMDFEYRLQPGEEAIDIKIIEGIKGLLCAALVAPVETAALTGTAYRNWIPTYRAARRAIWHKYNKDDAGPETFFERLSQSAMTDLITLIALLGPPVVPIAAHVFSVGDMTVQGYKHGIREALAKTRARSERLEELIREALDGLKE